MISQESIAETARGKKKKNVGCWCWKNTRTDGQKLRTCARKVDAAMERRKAICEKHCQGRINRM